MIKIDLRYVFILLLIAGITFGFTALSEEKSLTKELSPEEHTTAITGQTEETNFDIMMKVLTHKRCVNCHPSDDHPRQGEDMHLHYFEVQRGEKNHGIAVVQCETCHQHENNDFSGVPGAPEWSLAPISMRWLGLSRTEIAKSILDKDNNGGRSLDEIVKHLTEHELVLWAWEPGVDAEGNPREKPPVPVDEYIAAVKAWAVEGAPIPAE